MNSVRLDLTLDPQEEVRARNKFRPIIAQHGKQTHFSNGELEALLMVHYKLTKSRPMDRKYFRRVLYSLFTFQNDIMVERIFSAFDRNNKLLITGDSWILGLSVWLRGTLDEKINFCFRVYDMMNEGFIRRDSMFQSLKHTYRGNQLDVDPEELARDLVEEILKRMDLDRDGILSFEDYRNSVWKNNNFLEVLGYVFPARPAIYSFMNTFTSNITTVHSRMYSKKPFRCRSNM